MTYAEFKASIKAKLFPDGEAEQLVSVHDQSILEALVDLQRYCTGMQERHEDILPQAATYFRKGWTVLDAPEGRISRISVMVGDDWDSRITYDPATYQELNAWGRRFNDMITAGMPANAEHPSLMLSFKYPEATTDSIYGRAIAGIWCNERGRIYVAPWIQSAEKILIEWDGIKTSFDDSDQVNYGPAVQKAICCYVKQDRPMDFPEGKEMVRKWIADWLAARADVIYDYENNQRLPEAQSTYGDSERAMEVEDATLNVTATVDGPEPLASGGNEIVFAMVSDTHFENATQEIQTASVASLIAGRSVDFIVHAGDISDNATNYEANIGKYYGKYIFPYKGQIPGYGEADANQFWPAIGNHDTDSGSTASFIDFFSYPITNQYYDLVRGAAHFFFLDINRMIFGGDQYKWFIRRLALSTCPWKIVVVHYGPYTSDDVHADAELVDIRAWDLNALGVDLVLSGHSHIYERLEYARSNPEEWDLLPPLLKPHSNLTCIVNGLGGGKYYGIGAIDPGSVVRHTGESGALFVTANSTTLSGEFVNTAGDVIDTFELTKSPV